MSDPTITCPHCKKEIKLNESLAAPLIEATRKDYEKKIAGMESQFAGREEVLRKRQADIEKERANIESSVADKLESEKKRITEEESRKAQKIAALDLEKKAREVAELQSVLDKRTAQLAEVQKVEAEMLRKQRDLDDAMREMELTVEKKVQASIETLRTNARREAEENMKLRVLEKEQTISAMQKQIEDLKRRAEQGSQQLQGEVQEMALEQILSARFTSDIIEPVPKGEHGGDILQRVSAGNGGSPAGTILWESKRTKNWSDGWLGKLRNDQRTAKAEIAVLVTHALPREIESFDLLDGVWVASPRMIVPVALMLRESLVELARTRIASEGRQTKQERLYAYLTGSHFRQRLEAIAEAFSTMRDELEQEKRVLTKQWAKREKQIEQIMLATTGMCGDMQGIAGQTMQGIEGFDLKALE